MEFFVEFDFIMGNHESFNEFKRIADWEFYCDEF
jgi:hypothetical protein